MSNAMGQIDAEHGDGRAADGGAADQDRPVPAEVTGAASFLRTVEWAEAGSTATTGGYPAIQTPDRHV
jgi:hypothetical protein